MMGCNDVDSALKSYSKIPEPQKTLFAWLLDFLASIAKNAEKNKMTAQNLAIVVAPNLYDISTPNPMEGLILSQVLLNNWNSSHFSFFLFFFFKKPESRSFFQLYT